ncbi:MAG TPA: 1,4-dihydroxy-2-naphthoate polyprenyltransferase [Cytophagaceae bacterium]
MEKATVSVSPWITAMRLRTLPLALSSILMGTFLASHSGSFNLPVFLLCITTTIFLQVLSNLANDYGDYVNGADSTNRKGPERMVHTGKISPQAMKSAIVVFTLLSLASGILLLSISLGVTLQSLGTFLFFFITGLLSIGAAIKYTMGKNPYGYAGLGDISVFIFFGIVGVAGSYYLYKLSIDPVILLPAFACGFFSAAVLNVNNIRDIDSDKEAGKRSIPVRLGPFKARVYHVFLLSSGFISAMVFTIINYTHPLQFLFLISLPLLIINAVKVCKLSTAQELDPYLKQMALTTLLFVITFGIGLLLA